jgi:hypothetical protein
MRQGRSSSRLPCRQPLCPGYAVFEVNRYCAGAACAALKLVLTLPMQICEPAPAGAGSDTSAAPAGAAYEALELVLMLPVHPTSLYWCCLCHNRSPLPALQRQRRPVGIAMYECRHKHSALLPTLPVQRWPPLDCMLALISQ